MTNTSPTLRRAVFFALCLYVCSFRAFAIADSSSYTKPLKYIPPVFRAMGMQTDSNMKKLLKPIISDFTLLQLNQAELNTFVKRYEYFSRFYLDLAGSSYLLEMQVNDMRSNHYTSSSSSVSGTVVHQRDPAEIINTYKGFADDDRNNIVRLTISSNELSGYIYIKSLNEWLYLEPLNNVLRNIGGVPLVNENVLISYHLQNLIFNPRGDIDPDRINVNVDTETPDPCIPLTLEIATDADMEFYTKYGSNTNNVKSQIKSYLNQVEGVYSANFNMVFSITNQHVWIDDSQPYKSTRADQFCVNINNTWNIQFPDVPRDIVHVWTGKTLDNGYWGYVPNHGGLGSVCYNNYSASGLTMERNGSFLTTAHEIGHNFNASHCDGNCQYLQSNSAGRWCNYHYDGSGRNSIMCQGDKSLYFNDGERAVISGWINQHISCLKNPNDQNVSGDWLHTWTNDRNNRKLGTWLMQPGDVTLTGDFDGDGSEEFLFIDGAGQWASMMQYECAYGSDWYHKWSNFGNSTIGNWLRHQGDRFFVADFNADGASDLFCVAGDNNWAMLQSYSNGVFKELWTNYGNRYITNNGGTMSAGDMYITGDFYGDGQDQLLYFNRNNSEIRLLEFNSAFYLKNWNSSSWKIAHVNMDANSIIRVADFENSGRKELMILNGNEANFLRYNPNNNQWENRYNVNNNMAGWNLPMRGQDALVVCNFDADPEDEYMFIQGGSDAQWTTSFGFNQGASAPQWNWSNNGNGQIADWNLRGAAGDGRCWYYPLQNNPDFRKQLFAVTCKLITIHHPALWWDPSTWSTPDTKYWEYPASLYRSSTPGTYKRTASADSTTNTGIQRHDKKMTVKIFPNPAEGIFTLSLSSSAQKEIYAVFIYDITGRLIYEKQNITEDHLVIDLSDYPKGMYMATVKMKEQSSVLKMIKY